MSNQMTKETTIHCNALKGAAYVKNSEGVRGNLYLFINCKLNTAGNSVEISYHVSVFKDHQKDHFSQSYVSYDYAVDKYNELAAKFDGYNTDN